MEHLQKSLQPSYLNQFQTNVQLSKVARFFFFLALFWVILKLMYSSLLPLELYKAYCLQSCENALKAAIVQIEIYFIREMS